ncbi:hypothetical protein ABPG72_004011 [Tetrahymena utriculariae]
MIKIKKQQNQELVDPELEESVKNSEFYNYIKENKLDQPLIKEIDKYKIPYCYQDAIDHRAATKIGVAIQNTSKICKCCSRPIEKNRKPFYEWEIKDMLFLGAGYPLYFSYLRLIMALYSVITCLSIASCIFNYKDNRCETNSHCEVTLSTSISYGNRNYSTNSYKGILLEMFNLLFIICFIVFIEKFYIVTQAKIKSDQAKSSCPSNYTVKINNIKWDSMQNPNLKNYIKQKIKIIDKQSNRIINQILVCFKTQRLRKYEQMIEQLVQQKQEFMRKYKDQIEYTSFNFNKECKIKRTLNKLVQFKERLKVQDQQSKQNINCLQKYFTGTVFVIFENQTDRNQILKMKNTFFEEHKWYLEDAEQPNEVIWDNFNLNYEDHLKRKKFMIGLLIVILLFGLGFIFFVYNQQDLISKKFKGYPFQNQIVSTLMSFSTLFVNTVLQFSLNKIIEYLSFQSKTMKATFYIIFNSVIQLINETLLQMIVFLIVNQENSSVFQDLFFSQFGLVNTQITTFVISIFNPAKLFIFDSGYYCKSYKKDKESKKNKSVKTQTQLQNIYEFPEFELEKFYSETLKSILTANFYLPVAPIFSLCLFLKILFYYFFTKMMFFNRRIVKYNLGNQLDEKVQIFLISSVAVFQFTWTLSFYVTHFDQQRWWEMLPTILGIIFVIAYFIFKYKKNKDIINKQNETLKNQDKIANKNETLKNYTEERDAFLTEYGRENPFTEFEEKNQFFLENERKNRKQESIIQRLNQIFVYKNRQYQFNQSLLKITNQSYFCRGVNKLMYDIMLALKYSRDLLQVKETNGIDYISYVNKKNKKIQKKLMRWAETQQNLLDKKMQVQI